MNRQQALQAYIPLDRQNAIANNIELPATATGTVLFADISGYTPLSQLFSEQLGADRGAEALTVHLNNFHTALVHELHQYRGSVLSFSGDACTCWLDGDTGERAIVVAFNMRAAIDRIKKVQVTPTHSAEIGLKVGIAFGPVHRFTVGNPLIQRMDAIAGNVLEIVAAAEEVAVAGDIVIGEEVHRNLKDKVDVIEWRIHPSGVKFAVVGQTKIQLPPNPWPTSLPIEPDKIKEWVLPPIFTHLASEDSHFLTELRDNTAFFLSFSGIDYDKDPDAGEKLDQFIRMVQDVFIRYEAFLLQLTIGEKGSYFVASFGALIAHEDDAARAAAAALEIIARVRNLTYIESVRIGINQGVVRAGSYGAPSRTTYGVQGSEINLAARLMQKAGEFEIIVSPSVVSHAQEFEYQSRQKTKLKGFDEPIEIFQLLGRKSGHSRKGSSSQIRVQLVGRDFELEQINRGLKAAQLATEYVPPILIEGEAGLGKSVLLDAALKAQLDASYQFWIGSADAVENTTAYFIWQSILSQLFNIDLKMDHDRIQTAVNQLIQSDQFLLDRAPLLQDILRISWTDNELTKSLSGAVRAENIRDFIIGSINLVYKQAVAEQTTPVLIIDDLHWIDSRSATILGRIRKEIPYLLMILLTRSIREGGQAREIDTLLNEIINEPDLIHLRLEPLQPASIEQMIAQKLAIRNLPAPVRTLIEEHAEGNPFYSEEIAYALRDLGFIMIHEGDVTFPKGTRFDNLRFPNTIQGVITSRIDRLHPSEQLTVKVASVIGRTIQVKLLSTVHPAKPEERNLFRQMENITERDILLLENQVLDLSYLFKHIITRDVAYSLLPYEQRKAIHQEVAKWLEQSEPDPAQLAPLLLYHWQRTEIPEKIRDYLVLASQQALRTGSFREADSFLTELLDLEQKGKLGQLREVQKVEWIWLSGRAKYGLGQLDEARTLFEQVVSKLDTPIPQSGGRLLSSILRNTALQIIHRMAPNRFFATANEEEKFRYQIAMQIYRDLNDIYFYMEEKIKLLYVGIRQINIAENVGHSPWLPQANAVLGVITGLFGLKSISDAYFDRATRAAQKVDDPAALGTVLLGNSLIKVGNGEWDKVEQNANQGLIIFDRAGRRKDWGDTLATLAFCRFFSGYHSNAKELFSQLLASTRFTEHTVHKIWSRTWLGAIALRDGEYAEAHDIFEEVSPLFEETADKVSEISFHGLWALTYLSRGDMESGKRELLKTIELIDATGGQPSGYFSREGYTAFCEFRLTQLSEDPKNKGLRADVRKALKAMKTFSRLFKIGKPALLFYSGWLQEIQGDSKKTINTYQKGFDQAVAADLPYEINQIAARMIPLLPTGDPLIKKIKSEANKARERMSP